MFLLNSFIGIRNYCSGVDKILCFLASYSESVKILPVVSLAELQYLCA